MRRMGGGKRTITATPRQLESLIRLAEARAKIRLSDTVEPDDVAEAIRLMNVATQRAATDPRTGTIDMDMIATGRAAVDRETIAQLVDACRQILTKEFAGKRLQLYELKKTLSENSGTDVAMGDVQEALRELTNENNRKFKFDTRTGSISVH